MAVWIIGEMDLLKKAINATFAGRTPESQLGDELRVLIATTGEMGDVEAWQWSDQIRSRRGKAFLEQMLAVGGGAAIGDKKCRISAGITDLQEFPLAKAVGLFSLAAAVTATTNKWMDVLNYQCWIKIPLDDMTDAVPAYLPSRTYTDENEQQQTHTWQSWATQRLTAPAQDDTHAYISTTAAADYPLCGSVLAQLASGGFNLVTSGDLPASESP